MYYFEPFYLSMSVYWRTPNFIKKNNVNHYVMVYKLAIFNFIIIIVVVVVVIKHERSTTQRGLCNHMRFK